MFIIYYDVIKNSDMTNEEKKILNSFLEKCDKYKSKQDIFSDYTNEDIIYILKIAKVSPSLQIEIWQILPDDIVNSLGNTELFENILDNKFGEYIKEINKKALVKMLNNSRIESRSNG